MIGKLPSPHSLFVIQILATAMMTGIIWFVQVVHYPLFTKIPVAGFVDYDQAHTVRTGWVVAPLMLVELGTALALLLAWSPEGVARGLGSFATDPLYLTALGCLLLIWISTFFLQVPLHGTLSRQADQGAVLLLISTNWIRTILWSVRLVLLTLLLPKALPA